MNIKRTSTTKGGFIRTIIMLLLFGCQLGFGQVTDECKPSTLNVPSAQYPCVYPDHRATFRVVAPEAQKVQVRVGQNLDMVKGTDGAWTVTTAPLRVKVLFLGIGSTEGPGTKNFSDQLTKAGIKSAYFKSAGTAHEWLTWRRCLNDFAPRLFK